MRECAFIGFGKAASAMALGLRDAGAEKIFFYTRNPTRHTARIKASGAIQKPDYASLAASSTLLISCVTGSSALEVARAVRPYLGTGHIYVDANTTSPQVKQNIAALFTGTGILFADAVIMGPVELLRHQVPIIACGAGAMPFYEAMTPLGMDIAVIDGDPGQAARLKILRSIFQKGMMCLLMETLGAARRYGVDRTVLDSLSKTFDRTPLKIMAENMVVKAIGKAERMVHEMEEVCAMLETEELPTLMAAASRQTLARCRDQRLPEPENLEEALQLLDVLARNESTTIS